MFERKYKKKNNKTILYNIQIVFSINKNLNLYYNKKKSLLW